MAKDMMAFLEGTGTPPRKFWENDLEMAVDPILALAMQEGFTEEWIGKLPGRRITILCGVLAINENGSVRKMKSALLDNNNDCIPYLLVDEFAKWKSKIAVTSFAKGVLPDTDLEVCAKKKEDDFDKTALLFAIYNRKPTDLRLVYHLDKVHKSGFARMKLKTNPQRPKLPIKDVLKKKHIRKILEIFDKKKHDGRNSEVKGVIPVDDRYFIFIRRAERRDRILGNGGIVHGYRPEWIILDFEDSAKRVNISSLSVSVPLEIANRIASEYFGKTCEYENESRITYAKQLERFLKLLKAGQIQEIPLVELVVQNSPLKGSPKIKITDPDSNPIGNAIRHFEKAIGGILSDIGNIESIKVHYRKKRVSLIFEAVEDEDDEYILRYSDQRLNGFERKQFEDYMRKAHEIPVLSTEKRFKR